MEVTEPEVFHALADHVLAQAGSSSAWSSGGKFEPQYKTAETLLSIPLRQGKPTQSGLFARAIDLWIAHELRRAGFGQDEVWPRGCQPRVLSQDLAALVREASDRRQVDLPAWMKKNHLRGSARSRILGAYYDKEVDVVIASWDRGLELMVSGRSMLSSYKSNLHNRSEDLLGDADNLRRRYPLASIGLFYLVRADIFDDPGSFEFVCDMLNRLRTPHLYDATAVVVLDYDDEDWGTWSGSFSPAELPDLLADPEMARILPDNTPPSLSVPRFFEDLIGCVLKRTPVNYHEEVRKLRGDT